MADRERKPDESSAGGGLLKGLTDLLEKLNELAETGQELHQNTEISTPDKRVRGVYGFNVRMGIGGKPVDVQPFGNVKFDKQSKQPVVQDVREPLVDVIEEPNRILVVAEMPGVTSADISVQIDGDKMTIEAHHGTKRYRKEQQLPRAVQNEAEITYNNGIVQIECRTNEG